jgi:hypothetical protein
MVNGRDAIPRSDRDDLFDVSLVEWTGEDEVGALSVPPLLEG